MKQKGVRLTLDWVAYHTRPAFTTCQLPTLPQHPCLWLVRIPTNPSENTAHMRGLLPSCTEKTASSTFSSNRRNSDWPLQRTSILLSHPSSRLQTWASACPNSMNHLSPRHTCTNREPSQSKPPWPQSSGTRAHTSWGFEREETGKWKGGILSRGWEENRTLENCKAKDAKRDSSLSQLLTREISPHLGMTSADLIFCHQSFRTCFNYAAHQQKFSF